MGKSIVRTLRQKPKSSARLDNTITSSYRVRMHPQARKMVQQVKVFVAKSSIPMVHPHG